MIVIDVETTGLDPARHAIVSIGAIDFAAPQVQFYEECRPWAGAVIDDGALAVNGFTRRVLYQEGRQTEKDLLASFLSWAAVSQDPTPAAMNPQFDCGFLQAACFRCEFPWPLGHRYVDLHSIAYAFLLGSGRPIPLRQGLSALGADQCLLLTGLPREVKPHNGLTGAKMEAEAMSRFLFGEGLLEEFRGHRVPEWVRREG